jgi:hypothetical protein
VTALTIDEARASIGRSVLWRPPCGTADSAEEGTITSVSDRWAFVCFGRAGTTSAATDPAELTLLAGKVPGHG